MKNNNLLQNYNITPDQDKELQDLFKRATLPVRPWALVIAGVLTVDLAGFVYSMGNYIQTHDKKIVTIYVVFLLGQIVAACAQGYRMHKAEKQLANKINEIKMQNSR